MFKGIKIKTPFSEKEGLKKLGLMEINMRLTDSIIKELDADIAIAIKCLTALHNP